MNYERKSAVLIKALKWLSTDKIKAIENREEHLHKVVRIYNTIDHLAKVERRNRKRRNTMAKQQNEIPAKRQKLDYAAQEETLAYKQEVDEMFNSIPIKRIRFKRKYLRLQHNYSSS